MMAVRISAYVSGTVSKERVRAMIGEMVKSWAMRSIAVRVTVDKII